MRSSEDKSSPFHPHCTFSHLWWRTSGTRVVSSCTSVRDNQGFSCCHLHETDVLLALYLPSGLSAERAVALSGRPSSGRPQETSRHTSQRRQGRLSKQGQEDTRKDNTGRGTLHYTQLPPPPPACQGRAKREQPPTWVGFLSMVNLSVTDVPCVCVGERGRARERHCPLAIFYF